MIWGGVIPWYSTPFSPGVAQALLETLDDEGWVLVGPAEIVTQT
jgi:hypothetical protein